ncbi:MAG: GTP 3',8-cyclase MoaA [Ndongobacter sp.]|nr:GTP 3',8-cyclase MoaA [Ndongobacter sp.]
MKDQYGRTIRYLRLSVTDRCNLHCRYCRPRGQAEENSAEEALLTDREILFLTRLFSERGIRRIKLTGGEPLLRPNLCALVGAIKRLPLIEQVTLTTNGIYLGLFLDELQKGGIDAINISLNTLDPRRYERITGYDGFQTVRDNVYRSLRRGIQTKINVVPQIAENSAELEAFAELAREDALSVRFIEMMPLGIADAAEGIDGATVLARLQRRYGKATPSPEPCGNGPASYYQFPGFRGRIGIISAVSHPFCASCNRIRLTAQGILKPCLQFEGGIDLRRLLRQGADEASMLTQIEEGIYRKPQRHCFSEGLLPDGETRLMSEIGG